MKNNIKLIAIILITVFTTSLVAKPSVTLSTEISNKYLTFATGAPLSEEKVIQPNLNVAWDNGVYVNVWASRPLARNVPKSDFSFENDFGIGWAGEFDYWMLDISLTYYDEPALGKFGADDIWFSNLKLSHGFGPMNLDLEYGGYTARKGSAYEGGHAVSAGISKEIDYQERMSLASSAKLAFDDGGFGLDKGLVAIGELAATWKVSKRISVTAPKIALYVPVTVRDARRTEVVWTAGFEMKL